MPWRNYATEHAEKLWKHVDVGCVMLEQSLSIRAVNQCFASTLGYTSTELEGKHIDEITDYEFRGTGSTEIHKVDTGEIPYFEQQKQYLRRDGQAVKARVFSFAIPGPEQYRSLFFSRGF